MERRAERLHGDVSLAVPVSWQIIGYLILVALAIAMAFLASASYARVEHVSGALVIDKGVAAIVPTRPGVVAALSVREGQRVRAGDPLVAIRSEEDMDAGGTAPRRVLDALEQQDRRLAAQTSLLLSAADAEQARLAEQMEGAASELASLDAQIADQQRLVSVAQNEFLAVQGIAEKGFISRRDVEAREATVLARRQQLSQLEQARSAKRADLAEARRAIAQSGAAAQAQAAGVQSSRAELAQQAAQAEAAKGYTLTSPVAGTVTALTARLGQPATSEAPLMVVTPADGRVRVELHVPTSAAGFLQSGQKVRLAIDAFPYQRFGTVEARITDISGAAVPRPAPGGGIAPIYLVTAELSRDWVTAFGHRQPLLPGMTLSARIVTDERTLLEWLFEPLFAVRRR